MSLVELNWPLNKFYFDLNQSYFTSRGECYLLQPALSEFILFHITDRFLEFNIDVLHCSIILIPIWTEHSAVLLCHFDVYSMIISKLVLVKFSLTSHLSYNRQNLGILLNNCLCIIVLICICHCLVRVRARVCEGERVWVVYFVCLFCMPCVEWVWMILFYYFMLFIVGQKLP